MKQTRTCFETLSCVVIVRVDYVIIGVTAGIQGFRAWGGSMEETKVLRLIGKILIGRKDGDRLRDRRQLRNFIDANNRGRACR